MRTEFKLESFSLSKFKCFERQSTMHFAPLTLVFGHNSAGKSLMMGNIANMFGGIESKGRSHIRITRCEKLPSVSSRSMDLNGHFGLDFEMNLKITDYFISENESKNHSIFISFVFMNPLTKRSYSVYLLRHIEVLKERNNNDSISPSINRQTIEDHFNLLDQGPLKIFIMKLLNCNEQDELRLYDSQWVLYGGWNLEQHLRDLVNSEASQIKKSEFDSYVTGHLFPTFDLPNFDSEDQEKEFEIGFEKIRWLFDRLIRTYSKLSHLGPIRERPAESWIFQENQNTISPVLNYLNGTGDSLWPMIEALKDQEDEELELSNDVEDETPTADILEDINAYLTHLETHILLTPNRDFKEFIERQTDVYDDLSHIERVWLERMPNAISKGHFGITIWRNLGAEIEFEMKNWETKVGSPMTWMKLFGFESILYSSLLSRCLLKFTLKEQYQHCFKRVGISDVGSGISQIMPILVNLSFASNRVVEHVDLRHNTIPLGQIIMTEQPELHLHPKAQGKLADLFINSLFDRKEMQDATNTWSTLAIDKESDNRIMHIIETHSEIFLLRIKKRVARGEIPPSMIAVNYVWQDQDGTSHVKHIRLDEQGDFIDSWPDGFFLERFNETIYD